MGVAENMCKKDKLLSSIVDAADDKTEAKNIDKGKEAEAALQMGTKNDRVQAMVNGEIRSGNGHGENSLEDSKESEDQDEEKYCRKRRRKAPVLAQMNNGPAHFGESMREIEIAKIKLQAKRLKFEESCHEDHMHELAIENAKEV